MRNAPCTPLSPQEESAIMKAFSALLTPEEDEQAAELFQPYIFYETLPDRSRDCWCSSCRERFNVTRRGNAAFFRASHKGKRNANQNKSKADCPICRTESKLIASNKFSTFRSLCEHRLVARLSAFDGWLLVQSGVVVREFERDYGAVTDTFRFHEFRRFAFKPGRRHEWTLRWLIQTCSQCDWVRAGAADFLPGGCYSNVIGTRWDAAKSVGEAHYPAPYHAAQAYYILNPDALSQSDMRYCQYFAWFHDEYGDDDESYAHLCSYLSEFTRRPQMEFLVKLDYRSVISDLLLCGKLNRDLLNWKATNPADFFGLSKPDFRAFRDADGDLKALKLFRDIKERGLCADMREFAEARQRFFERFDAFLECCATAGVTVRRGADYVQKSAVRLSPPHAGIRQGILPETHTSAYFCEAIIMWRDYLSDAQRLRYDLTRDDVRTPRNLLERHDAAAATVKAEEDAAQRKKYRNLYAALQLRYEYGADGLKIVVPSCAQDIIQEGRTLHHCVGGYAARHLDGKLAILFLRREEAPDMPYVTIEMNVDNNPARLGIMQIHGYRNDIGAESPRETHKEFLDKWLAWVHKGSPRNENGTPSEGGRRIKVPAQ